MGEKQTTPVSIDIQTHRQLRALQLTERFGEQTLAGIIKYAVNQLCATERQKIMESVGIITQTNTE
jgi:hypothetical protein